jgi:uncharacterized membrane protein YuzA (DUF378 family)
MTTEPTLPEQPHVDAWRKYWPALWLLLILAVVAVVRIRLLSLPLERDEGEFAYAGQLMLEGVPPYKLLYNMKMPGIYAAYALIMAVFGQSSAGIHLGFMLVNMAAIVLLYFVGRRFLDRAGAVAGSASYALLSASPQVLGLSAHATHFVVLAALGGILVLLRAQERGSPAGFFWSGAIFGLAFLLKQHGGAFALFGGALMVWTALRRKAPNWKKDAARLAIYAAGVSVPIFLTGLILWRAGVWDKFWWWTVTYARTHSTAFTWAGGLPTLAKFFRQSSWNGLIWGLALAGLCGLLAGKGRADERFFFLSLLFFSAAAVVPGFQFTSHYFVLVLPVVSLLAARFCTRAASGLAASPIKILRVAPWILFGLIWAAAAWNHAPAFFEMEPEELVARIYSGNDFQVYPVLADYLANHAPSTATFAVIGSEPELLFYAHRRSVTGYIYMYDLVERQPFRERMANEMMAEVEQGHADYLIFVNVNSSWLPYPHECLDQVVKWFFSYSQREYDPCGVVPVQPSQFVWGPDCLQRVPPSQRMILIFKRKPPADLPKPAP